MDKIRNEYIRGTAQVGKFGEKTRETRLRWYGHLRRKDDGFIGRRMLRMELPGKRKRGRPKRRFMDVVKEYMAEVEVKIQLIETTGEGKSAVATPDGKKPKEEEEVDAHSKYIDAHVVSPATTSATISKLRQTFAVLGLPITIVSDNGSCFTSDEFEQLCKANGITYVKCSPYHPSSNGLAERAVQTVKAGLKKTTGNLEDRLCNFLTRYRVTPQSTTGQTPAECVLKNRPVLAWIYYVHPYRTVLSRSRPTTNSVTTPLQPNERSELETMCGL